MEDKAGPPEHEHHKRLSHICNHTLPILIGCTVYVALLTTIQVIHQFMRPSC